MSKVRIWGFQCSRCGHKWLPRDGVDQPQVCPSCKSPYWDRPRRADVKPEHSVTCNWQATELDGKTVEYEVVRNKKTKAGVGFFSASDLGEGRIQIMIRDPIDEDSEPLRLVQAEADCIKTHLGKYRFSCFSRA
jgi:DNA-directed RNA polymerase subunit RPC12/RpoP